MTALAEQYKERFFGSDEHPYRTLERTVETYLQAHHTLLDAGCGRTAPVLVKYRGKAQRLVDFPAPIDGIELLKNDLSSIPLRDESVDVVMCRSVMEHVANPLAVYGEIHRVLKRGGHFIFLTGNFWDYAALIATGVPNRLHPWIERVRLHVEPQHLDQRPVEREGTMMPTRS